MKLQHIRQSLDDIKKDDLIIIEELKNKINDLERLLNKKYVELDEIETRKSIINNILDIKDNKRSLFRVLRPLLEFALIGIAAVMVVISVEALSAFLILLVCFILGLSADALTIIQKEYNKITESTDSSIKLIINALCNIAKKRNVLSINMDECLMAEELINSEIKKMEEEMSKNRSKRDSLKEEVSFIEGNSHAVNCLIEKYKFEEMPNDNPLVQFIEDKEEKKELKKIVSPAEAY